MKRDLKTWDDFSSQDILKILNLAQSLKKNPFLHQEIFKGRSFGLLFEKPSNRTRVSFEVGIHQLGGHSIYLGPNDIHLGVRESVSDVAKTLSRYLDAVIARVFQHKTIEELSSHGSIPIINGLSDKAHPCQVLADLFSIKEKFKDNPVTVAYIGDGNNICRSLLTICAKMGLNIHIATPKDKHYKLDEKRLKQAHKEAQKNGSHVRVFHQASEAVKGVNVVYTDTWMSMGQEKELEQRLHLFKGFQVNQSLMNQAQSNCVFMHCLPAHREREVAAEVIDGAQSIVFDQAENRLHTQKAMLLFLLEEKVFGGI